MADKMKRKQEWKLDKTFNFLQVLLNQTCSILIYVNESFKGFMRFASSLKSVQVELKLFLFVNSNSDKRVMRLLLELSNVQV